MGVLAVCSLPPVCLGGWAFCLVSGYAARVAAARVVRRRRTAGFPRTRRYSGATVPDPDELPGSGIEIVLADDHTMVRRGLRMVLDAEPGLTVVAEAGDVDSALRATRERRPRVVVLDLNMPGDPTLPAIPRFLEAAPGVAVVVLTMESDPLFARRALAAGASGYVLKEGAEDELVDAIRAVAGGGPTSIRASAAAWPRVRRPSSGPARSSRVIASRASPAAAAWASCTARPI